MANEALDGGLTDPERISPTQQNHSASATIATPLPPKEERDGRGESSASTSSDEASEDEGPAIKEAGGFEPLRTNQSTPSSRPKLGKSQSRMTEDDIFQALSRRRTNTSATSAETEEEEQAEIEKLMSRMFGRTRQENSEEEKTRHVGVVFKNLTVKGMGLGAALQPTNGDVFLGLPRTIRTLFTKGAAAAFGKPPVRNLLTDFTGSIRPGEMTLVLGRPGSGCSTFLKMLGNQRFGFEDVQGEVTYGGTDAKIMAKDFRGEVRVFP